MRLFLIIVVVLTLAGPLVLMLSGKISLTADYRTANRDSAHLAPDPLITPQAVIQVYSARAFSWRGIIAMHTWMAIKPTNAQHYTVYQVIGWRLYRKLSPIAVMQDIPDRNWFNQKPSIILDIRGQDAEKMIPNIVAAVKQYPYMTEYLTWPGPNSNTFIAYVARQVPRMQLTLPSNALGKDFLPHSTFFANAPSGTGYQFSFYGLLGLMIAKKEGIEINILGLVYGFSPTLKVLKLPGFGDILVTFH